QPQVVRGGPFVIPQQLTNPVYDSRGDRLLAVETTLGGRGFGDFGRSPRLWIGSRTDGWTRRPGSAPPAGTTELVVDGQRDILAVGTQGVFRLSSKESESFTPAGPVPPLPLPLQAPLASALNVATEEVAFRSQNTVTVLARNSDGTYTKKQAAEI